MYLADINSGSELVACLHCRS